jgi:pimeloyl-ACP methyl ester carboxylesterase
MPVYICGGRFDRAAPLENQISLLKQIQHSRLTIFEGSHMLLWQDRLAFTTIAQFLLLQKFS